MHTLSNEAPIILTWVPKEKGATVSQENLDIIKKYVKLCEKTPEVDTRKIYLALNGHGFQDSQIDEIKKYLDEVSYKVEVIDLHDYNWSKIDEGWKINGEETKIKDYYKNCYDKDDKDRIYITVAIDTFRLDALALSDQITGQDIGAIYTDFDVLGEMKKPIEKDIPIYQGIVLGDIKNNDLIVVTNSSVADEIMKSYKEKLLTQEKMLSEIKRGVQSDTYVSNLSKLGVKLNSLHLRRIFDNADENKKVSVLTYTEIFSIHKQIV